MHIFLFLNRGIILWIELSQPENGIHCWWDLIRSKQLSNVSVCRMQVLARFSGHGNSIHIIKCLGRFQTIPEDPAQTDF